MSCVEDAKNKTDKSECLPNCEGLYIASYSRTEISDTSFINDIFNDYERFKGYVPFPESLKGLEITPECKLFSVRIYFRLCMEV